MSRGKTITISDMFVVGGTNILQGSNFDDEITINYSMYATRGAANYVALGDGNDTLLIRSRMQGSGNNIIDGGSGNKNIAVNGGMAAEGGAHNQIVFNGQSTDTRNISIGTVTARQPSENAIVTTDGTDFISFTGKYTAGNGGHNIVQLGNGIKHISLHKGFVAQSGGINDFVFGDGQHVLDTSNMKSNGNGVNRIVSVSGDNLISIDGQMSGEGHNEINLGYGQQEISIGSITSGGKGVNSIHTAGMTSLTVNGNVKSSSFNQIETSIDNDVIHIKGDLDASYNGQNSIDTSEGDDIVVIGGKMSAISGTNYINTGEGDDFIAVQGGASSCFSGRNIIQTGEGNDTIQLSGAIGSHALEINAGGGYDTLVLSANSLKNFNSDYKSWFTDVSNNTGLTATGIEAVHVDVGQNYSLGSVDWLTQILNNHNSANPNNHIDMEVNVDSFGEHITVGALFSNADESAINLLDFSGSNANTLDIRSSLRSGGYDGQNLHVKGDSNDTVTFDHLWQDNGFTTDQNTGVDYHVFSNIYGEDVMVQAGMNILYV